METNNIEEVIMMINIIALIVALVVGQTVSALIVMGITMKVVTSKRFMKKYANIAKNMVEMMDDDM